MGEGDLKRSYPLSMSIVATAGAGDGVGACEGRVIASPVSAKVGAGVGTPGSSVGMPGDVVLDAGSPEHPGKSESSSSLPPS